MFTDIDDLGIYDNNNADTAQGIDFLDNRKKYSIASGNNHDLLCISSSPNMASITEAIEGYASISSFPTANQTKYTADKAAFDALLAQYTTEYNTYITANSTSATDSSGQTLLNLNQQLSVLAQTIITDINNLKTSDTTLNASIQSNQANIMTSLQRLQNQRQILSDISNNFDINSLDGNIEVTALNMNSVYLKYIVYFFIGLLLIVFIFNITVNPNADVMKSVFLLVSLLSVYIISRWFNT